MATTDLALRWARRGCWLGMAVCLTNIMYTFGSDFPFEPGALRIVPLVIGVLALVGAFVSVRHLSERRAKLRWRIPSTHWKNLPLAARIAIRVIQVAVIANFHPLWSKGMPEKTQDGYILKNHASIVPVSYQEYLQVLASEARIVPLLALGFYASAAALLTIRLACPPDSHIGAELRAG